MKATINGKVIAQSDDTTYIEKEISIFHSTQL
jgi:hypothetical protein